MTNWKRIAITLMVIFILETALFVWFIMLGVNSINEEYTCNNICSEKKATGYNYDSEHKWCSCYEGKELVYADKIRSGR